MVHKNIYIYIFFPFFFSFFSTLVLIGYMSSYFPLNSDFFFLFINQFHPPSTPGDAKTRTIKISWPTRAPVVTFIKTHAGKDQYSGFWACLKGWMRMRIRRAKWLGGNHVSFWCYSLDLLIHRKTVFRVGGRGRAKEFYSAFLCHPPPPTRPPAPPVAGAKKKERENKKKIKKIDLF